MEVTLLSPYFLPHPLVYVVICFLTLSYLSAVVAAVNSFQTNEDMSAWHSAVVA